MASSSMSSDGDLEAQRQRDILQPYRASYHLPRHYSLG